MDIEQTEAGVIVRAANGRFAPGTRNPVITSDNAHEMLRLRREKRARLATEGALRAVLDAELIVKYGDDAPLVERAQTLQTIASTPNAGKAAVMSAQYLDKLQGYADDPADPVQVVDAVAQLVRELATFAATVAGDPAQGAGAMQLQDEDTSGGWVDGVVAVDGDG